MENWSDFFHRFLGCFERNRILSIEGARGLVEKAICNCVKIMKYL